jgi:hypothetical protein
MKYEPLPQHLFMNIPSYGQTGTLKGATHEQIATMLGIMSDEGLAFEDEFFWHFGDAVGADQQAFDVVTSEYPFQAVTVAHPGLNLKGNQRAFCKASQVREPMENLARNARIVYSAHNGLFSLPRTIHEILHSGTWMTTRVSGKLQRPCWVIKPDGRFDFYEKGYNTVLRRDLLDRDDVNML